MTIAALMAALSLIFSYVEVLIPFTVGIPGIKLGVANIVVIIALYYLGPKYAITINIIRVLIAGLLFPALKAMPKGKHLFVLVPGIYPHLFEQLSWRSMRQNVLFLCYGYFNVDWQLAEEGKHFSSDIFTNVLEILMRNISTIPIPQ